MLRILFHIRIHFSLPGQYIPEGHPPPKKSGNRIHPNLKLTAKSRLLIQKEELEEILSF